MVSQRGLALGRFAVLDVGQKLGCALLVGAIVTNDAEDLVSESAAIKRNNGREAVPDLAHDCGSQADGGTVVSWTFRESTVVV